MRNASPTIARETRIPCRVPRRGTRGGTGPRYAGSEVARVAIGEEVEARIDDVEGIGEDEAHQATALVKAAWWSRRAR